MWKEKARIIFDYIIKHSKVVFPVIVVAAVAVTVSIALNASRAKNGEEGLPDLESTESTEETEIQSADGSAPMVENEDPAITALITTFYNAMASGDTDALSSVCDEISVQDMLRYQEQAKYIENYPVIEIYTKKGPEAGSTIVFIYYKVKFVDHEEEFPGYTAHYVCTDDQGELYIRRGENSEEVNQYIGKVIAQDDVVEFNNRVTVEYNELMAAHPELLEYQSELDAQVSAAVGVALANVNGEGTQQEDGSAENGEAVNPDNAENADGSAEQTPGETPSENVVQYATATTTVNVRSSDSEQADKLGKVSGGTQLQVLEQRVNGWTKVLFEGSEGYIKSEFLSMVESAEGVESIGTVTATTNINVRSAASETAERLGVLAGGDSAELLANENGWCKIKYNGQVGYVKSDYVQ